MQGETHSSAGQMASMNPPTSEDLRILERLRQENRTLRWKAKGLGKQLGKQGQTIFRLRNEVAALREAITVSPGTIQRLIASTQELVVLNDDLVAENLRLREKLAAKESV